MKKILTALFCISSLAFSSPLFAHNETTCKQVKFQSTDSTWAGHYYLQGVMEVGSELLLEPNGKFKWYLAVGALDQYAEGTWWKNGNCIGLKAAAKYAKNLEIFPTRLEIHDKDLAVTWLGGQQDGVYRVAEQLP